MELLQRPTPEGCPGARLQRILLEMDVSQPWQSLFLAGMCRKREWTCLPRLTSIQSSWHVYNIFGQAARPT